MLKKVIEKTRDIGNVVRRWLDARRRVRLAREWQGAENFLDNTTYNTGMLCMYDGKLRKAARLFRKVVKDDPKDILGWYMIGETNWLMGRMEEARTGYVKAWQLRETLNEGDSKEVIADIRKGLVCSGAVAKERDADRL
jgi:tetratricopeptide (TPR) repeat protein